MIIPNCLGVCPILRGCAPSFASGEGWGADTNRMMFACLSVPHPCCARMGHRRRNGECQTPPGRGRNGIPIYREPPFRRHLSQPAKYIANGTFENPAEPARHGALRLLCSLVTGLACQGVKHHLSIATYHPGDSSAQAQFDHNLCICSSLRGRAPQVTPYFGPRGGIVM